MHEKDECDLVSLFRAHLHRVRLGVVPLLELHVRRRPGLVRIDPLGVRADGRGEILDGLHRLLQLELALASRPEARVLDLV